ncbi:fibronectin type III domain-containing protein [Adlercreutzia caecimuris]|uniref:fibronectin type III domain-containing protein n=1 Tax=Adlercreutzia caecimuris TaxID=671266 RepID=UPI0025848EDC|nr:fibronectin type III domain-containing protein [Adlercreutzia caecimuris]
MATVKIDSKDLTIERLAGDQRGKCRAAWKAPTKEISITFVGKKGVKETSKKKAFECISGYKVMFDYEVMVIDAKKKIRHPKTVTGSWTTTTARNATFDIPAGATGVTVHVKPIPKEVQTYKNEKDSKGRKKAVKSGKKKWFTAAEQKKTVNTGAFHSPERPAITGAKVASDGITIEVSVKDSDPYTELFQVEGNKGEVHQSHKVKEDTFTYEKEATVALTGRPGREYEIRARMQNIIGEWSVWYTLVGGDGKAVKVRTRPAKAAAPDAMATSAGTASLTWKSAAGADWYEIAYANDAKAFSLSSGYEVKSTEGSKSPQLCEFTFDDLDQGRSWFFWVRGCNESGDGEWSEASNEVVLGTPPTAPSVWADALAVVKGSPAGISWQHNSSDGSPQRKAEVWTSLGGAPFRKTEVAGSKSTLDIPTSSMSDGTELRVYVRTYGAHADPSPASETLTIGVWDRPEARVSAPSPATSYPIPVTVETSAPRQQCVVLVLSIFAVGEQQIASADGTERTVRDGEELLRQVHLNAANPLTVELMPSDALLLDGATYRVAASCSMSSGLSCADEAEMPCDFEQQEADIDADILPFGEWSCEVVPAAYAVPEEVGEGIPAVPAEGWLMSVYRIETDGTLTALLANAPSDGSRSVVDAHAALSDQAYRVVGIDPTSGAVAWEDFTGDVRMRRGLLIQWDGDASAAREYVDGEPVGGSPIEPGSSLFLQYSNDGSVDNDMDVDLTEYIGDLHPTSDYGTQLGQTASWSARIRASDTETLGMLRKLACHRGDVYVRDKLGDGYWAVAKPSWRFADGSPKIDVSVKLTRTTGSDECIVLDVPPNTVEEVPW